MPDRLTTLDALFLNFEHPHAPMHVAGLYTFNSTPEIPGRPGLSGLFRTIEERIGEIPRYRQRVVNLPLGLGNPVWVDDPEFDLSYHLRRAALPSPGGMTELLDYVARIHARPLDRRRPLWEVYVIEGLDGGERAALYSKVHHAMIDGISGMDLAGILLDVDPEGRPAKTVARPRPAAIPSGPRLLADFAGELAGRAARGVIGAVRRPTSIPGTVAGAIGNVTTLQRIANLLVPVPRGPMNVPVGTARRIALVPISLARAKAIKNALGGTVNDVLLAAYGEAIHHFLEHRDVPHAEELYRVMVPVSVRDETERGALGNRVTAMFVDLPVGPMPAKRRLAAVTRAMGDLKERKQAVAAEALQALSGLAPATLHGLAGRLEFTNQRFVNTVLSNVPGAPYPLYSGGSLMLEMYPLLPLTANVAVVTCVTSYNGGLYFGVIGDYDAIPDVDVLGDGLRRGFDRLEIAAMEAKHGREAVETLGEPSVEVAGRGRARNGRAGVSAGSRRRTRRAG
jgi:diacylglycerol O-acyltransferase / wax synthase